MAEPKFIDDKTREKLLRKEVELKERAARVARRQYGYQQGSGDPEEFIYQRLEKKEETLLEQRFNALETKLLGRIDEALTNPYRRAAAIDQASISRNQATWHLPVLLSIILAGVAYSIGYYAIPHSYAPSSSFLLETYHGRP